MLTRLLLLRTALVAGVLMAIPAGAGIDLAAPLKEAQAALAAGDYERAYALYRGFAEDKNNPLAQFTLALFHQIGWGRPVDREAACRWHARAAEGHIPAAAHYLGECFQQGVGRPADAGEAASWYQRAAGLGHHLSLCSLAELYMRGEGVERDPRKGLELCMRAAQSGSPPARVRVGRYLLAGDESIRDPKAAHAWFEGAAATSPEAQYYLGVIHRDGLGHAVEKHQARLWFERAASRGYVPAYFQTARLYFGDAPELGDRKPPAQELAKSYMWLSATAQRSTDAGELEQTKAMLKQVLAIMPETWIADLDERVAAHLAEFSP